MPYEAGLLLFLTIQAEDFMLNVSKKVPMEPDFTNYYCNDCPRKCNALRTPENGAGVCGCPSLIRIARAAPHFGEEPCISGSKGSGAIFFEGCNLKCIFCQNYEISRSAKRSAGRTVEELRSIILKLQDSGVHNINLVTPTHYSRQIAEALSGITLHIPVVWNSSAYESVETLRNLDGLVQIYMPDYKYASSETAKKYSAAPDYPETAAAAIKEMYRQTGPYVMCDDGLLKSGVLIRHLILPGSDKNTSNSMNVIDFVADELPLGSVLFSLMSQYTPMPASAKYPELTGRLDCETAELLKHYMKTRRLEDGYYQDVESATTEMIPQWDGTGVQ